MYLIRFDRWHKIGCSTNVEQRIGQLRQFLPEEPVTVAVIEHSDMFALESGLHARFKDRRVGGEWFLLEPADVDWISKLTPGDISKLITPPERIELRFDLQRVARLTAQAKRRGLSVSAYIRQAVTKEIEADEATDAKR